MKINLEMPTAGAKVSDIVPKVKELHHHFFSYRWWKELFDFVAAFVGVVVLAPFLGIITIGIKLDSPGGAIFPRKQVGENGTEFTMYKFRTMFINNDDSAYKNYLTKYIQDSAPYKVDEEGMPVYKVTDDPRVSRFGSFLRKTNLDELPQLFNVLKGDMSLIGPRPDIPFAVGMYEDWHRQRLAVKPGITGLWQVQGRKNLSFEDMVRLDIEYIRRQSILLDIKILLKTIIVVFKKDGS